MTFLPCPVHAALSSRRRRACSAAGRWLAYIFTVFAGLAILGQGRAWAEPVLIEVEPFAAMPLTRPQNQEFGVGGGLALGLAYPIWPQLLVGARLQGLALLNNGGPQAEGRADNGYGAMYSAEAVVRIRPFAQAMQLRAPGLFIEGGVGGAATGDVQRVVFNVALGWGFPLSSLTVAPTLRYGQVIQPSDPIESRDARLASIGLRITFGDATPTVVLAEPVEPPKPSDVDGDGLADAVDGCPHQAEDEDGHEDADGCPDTDNDGDGILDTDDECPDQAEDVDEYRDNDGCPDPDNDLDGFLDADDQCPDEAEVVNGNKDYDGCPDEGLIEFKDDRIVLEERVLFDMERARVRRAARPVLSAIERLRRQHPEWIEIRIEGHADARGDETYNRKLSERRARNVRLMLVELGIPPELMEAQGFGSTRLRDRRDDDEAHQRNRRVEFVVVARSAQSSAVDGSTGSDRSAVAPGPPSAAPLSVEDVAPAGADAAANSADADAKEGSP